MDASSMMLTLGVTIVLLVVVLAIFEYSRVSVELKGKGDLVEVLIQSSDELMEVIFKIAFLALAMSGGIYLIRHGMDMRKGMSSD